MWLSKSDLCQDLGVSTDIDVIKNKPKQRVVEESSDLADYYLYGSKPYRGGRDRQADYEELTMEPDLRNITSMVKLVKEADEIPLRASPPSTSLKNREERIVVITKSRLNPDVREFIPGRMNPDVMEFVPEQQKCCMNRDSSASISPRPTLTEQPSSSSELCSLNSALKKSPADTPSAIGANTDNPDQDFKVNLFKSKEDGIARIAERPSAIGTDTENPDQVHTNRGDEDEIAKLLKENYKASKKDKIKRNVAIDTLMKYYTTTPSSGNVPTSNVSRETKSHIHLIKPEDFLQKTVVTEGVDPYTKQVSINKVNKWLESSSKDVNDPTSSTTKATGTQTKSSDGSSKDQTKSVTKSSTSTASSSTKQTSISPSTSTIQSSISPSTSTRPPSISSTTKPTSSFKKYVPSKNIDKKMERLHKMKIEEIKVKKHVSIWDRAMDEMKAKEEKMHLERLKQQRQTENPTD